MINKDSNNNNKAANIEVKYLAFMFLYHVFCSASFTFISLSL